MKGVFLLSLLITIGFCQDVLVDQLDFTNDIGLISMKYFPTSNQPRMYLVADDFLIPTGQVWNITTVFFNGFINYADLTITNRNYTINFYANNATSFTQDPKKILYTGVNGSVSIEADTYVLVNITFNTSLSLGAGRYWVSVYETSDQKNVSYNTFQWLAKRTELPYTRFGHYPTSITPSKPSPTPFRDCDGCNDQSFIIFGTIQNVTVFVNTTYDEGVLYDQSDLKYLKDVLPTVSYPLQPLDDNRALFVKLADDFTVPPGPGWLITNFLLVGRPYGEYLKLSKNMTCEIYRNNETGGIPGELFWEYSVNVTEDWSGIESDYEIEIDIDPPLPIATGTYWLSCYAISIETISSDSGWGIQRSDNPNYMGRYEMMAYDTDGFYASPIVNGWYPSGRLQILADNAVFPFIIYGAVQGITTSIMVTTNGKQAVTTAAITTQAKINSTTMIATSTSTPSTSSLTGDFFVGDDNNKKKLSGGAIAGIVIALLVVIGAIAAVIFILLFLRKRKDDEKSMNKAETAEMTNYASMTASSSSVSAADSRSQSQVNLMDSRASGFKSSMMTFDISYRELQFLDKIGAGSFGEVYKGTWRNQSVAIKKVIDSTIAQREFTEEADLMMKIRPHENIVLFMGIVSDPMCIVLKFYEKGSLYSYIRSDAVISVREKLEIMRGIAAGVAHLHRENVIHRDLAARNILLTDKLNAVVSDFGFARLVKQETDVGATMNAVGPLKHMAPEALVSREYSQKTDAWSYGVTCFEIIARTEPYEGMSVLEVGIQVTHGLRLKVPPNSVPPVIEELITSCWNELPDARPTLQQCFDTLTLELSNNVNI